MLRQQGPKCPQCDAIDAQVEIRSKLVAPPGASQWLGELLMSCAREFGGGDALPELLGVLCAKVDDHHAAFLVRTAFFPEPYCRRSATVVGRAHYEREAQPAPGIIGPDEV